MRIIIPVKHCQKVIEICRFGAGDMNQNFVFFENAGSAHSSRGNSRLKETNVLSSRLGVKFWQLLILQRDLYKT